MEDDRLLGLAEAAQVVGLSHVRLRQLVAEHRLPAVPVGRTWAVRESAVRVLSQLVRPPGKPLWRYLPTAGLIDKYFGDCRQVTRDDLGLVSGSRSVGDSWSSASWTARTQLDRQPQLLPGLESAEAELHRVSAMWPAPFAADEWLRGAAADALLALVLREFPPDDASPEPYYCELVKAMAITIPWLTGGCPRQDGPE